MEYWKQKDDGDDDKYERMLSRSKTTLWVFVFIIVMVVIDWIFGWHLFRDFFEMLPPKEFRNR